MGGTRVKDTFEQVKKSVLTLEFQDEEIDELMTLLIRAERLKKTHGYDELGIAAKLFSVVDKANDDRWK
jgi:hypothetical protein